MKIVAYIFVHGLVLAARLIPRSKPTRPILWSEEWLPTHNNIRYQELLSRFKLVDTIHRPILPVDQRAPRESFVGRWENFWRTHLKTPFLMKYWSHRYKMHFCTSDSLFQITLFDGNIIVDEDDPIFTPDRINLLNAPHVLCVVTTTEQLKERFLKSGLEKPCYVIPSGVSLKLHSPERTEQLRQELCPHQDTVIVGYSIPEIFTNEDDAVKNSNAPTGQLRSISFLIQIMSHVWAANNNIELWLIGHPSTSVQAYAQVQPRCRLLGYIEHNQLLNYIAAFDIAVYPRVIDMFGRLSIKVIEYMAMGLPIVSTSVSEAFPIQEANAGLFADTAEAFAQHIVDLANSIQQRQKLGRNGLAYAKQFEWDTLARQYETEIFERYLRG